MGNVFKWIHTYTRCVSFPDSLIDTVLAVLIKKSICFFDLEDETGFDIVNTQGSTSWIPKVPLKLWNSERVSVSVSVLSNRFVKYAIQEILYDLCLCLLDGDPNLKKNGSGSALRFSLSKTSRFGGSVRISAAGQVQVPITLQMLRLIHFHCIFWQNAHLSWQNKDYDNDSIVYLVKKFENQLSYDHVL